MSDEFDFFKKKEEKPKSITKEESKSLTKPTPEPKAKYSDEIRFMYKIFLGKTIRDDKKAIKSLIAFLQSL